MLFVGSKRLPYIHVIDIRDDSTETESDRNYLDIEATYQFFTTSGASGFRNITSSDGLLYAINDAPESVFVIDLSTLEDNATHELIQDPPRAILESARGIESDVGGTTRANIGPGGMVLHPNGYLMAVSNFNTNSISFYDLRLGPYGSLINELELNTENPFALQFSPDGNTLVVGSYTGEMDGLSSHAELLVIDSNEDSPTYLDLLSRIRNR